MAARALRSGGYRVIGAAGAAEAFAAIRSEPTPPTVLVTDVIMPETTGRELADRLRVEQPDLRVLYLSGYAQDVIGPHGVLDPAESFLAKPFTPRSLLAKLREVIDARGAGPERARRLTRSWHRLPRLRATRAIDAAESGNAVPGFAARPLHWTVVRRWWVTKIEAVIQPSRLETLKNAFAAWGVEGLTVTEVKGYGRQRGHGEVYRGSEYAIDFRPKLKVEAVVPTSLVPRLLDVSSAAWGPGASATGRSSSCPWRRPSGCAPGSGARESCRLEGCTARRS